MSEADAEVLELLHAASEREDARTWANLERALDAGDRLIAQVITANAAKRGELGADPTSGASAPQTLPVGTLT